MSNGKLHIKIGNPDGNGCGCVTTILAITFIWAVLFGVTVGGKHYGMSCTNEEGVRIDIGRVEKSSKERAKVANAKSSTGK